MKKITFRCYTIKKENLFVSANVTLNLLCTGKTPFESMRNLITLTKDYLEEAIINKDLKARIHLLKRPAPLFMYVDYIKCAIIQTLFLIIFKISNNFKAFKKIFEIDYSVNKLHPCH